MCEPGAPKFCFALRSSTVFAGPDFGGGALLDPAKLAELAGIDLLGGTGFMGMVCGIGVPFDVTPRPFAVSTVSRAICKEVSVTACSSAMNFERCFSIVSLYSRHCFFHMLEYFGERGSGIHAPIDQFETPKFGVDFGKVFVHAVEFEFVVYVAHRQRRFEGL